MNNHESTFWKQVRFLLMHHLEQSQQGTLARAWCDWFDPGRYVVDGSGSFIEGHVGFLPGGRYVDVWRFTLFFNQAVDLPSDIDWEELIPDDDTAMHLTIDPIEKHIRIALNTPTSHSQVEP